MISRRALLRGAAGMGLAAVAGGVLLPACGSGGGGDYFTQLRKELQSA